MGVLHLNKESFETLITQSSQPVLIDFWATWCGPCRMLTPVVEQIAGEQRPGVKVCKLNVDDAQAIAAKYGIASVPAILFFKGGEVKDRLAGMQSKNRVTSKLEELA